MAILFYQIGIFAAIQIAALFGKSSRNIAIILISIFTLLQVYTNELMVLQFATIIISFLVSKGITAKEGDKIDNPKPNFGREFGEMPRTKNASTKSYGLSVSNPILMSSIPSSYRFLDGITNDNPQLSYVRNGSTQHSNFPEPIDMYEFSRNGNVITTIYIYPYYNSNVEIVPDILR